MTVVGGTAVATQNGSTLSIQTSDRTFLNWNSFNIAAGETTRFVQPGPGSVVFNQIGGNSPSQIFGRLEANGQVVLANPNGFYFGPTAFVKAASFVAAASTGLPQGMKPEDFWQLHAQGAVPGAGVVNLGKIEVDQGGSAYLIAPRVENRGTITAPEGDIRLYAGKDVLVCERPDGRGLTAKVKLPEGSVDNYGRLVADGGVIAMHAQVVNNGGLVQADTVRERNGVIELVASEKIGLSKDSVLQATGGSKGVSQGGEVIIKSEQAFEDTQGSRIVARGGEEGGDGGQVEVSAARMGQIRSQMDAKAGSGFLGGHLLLDPDSIAIGSAGGGDLSGGGVGAGDPPSLLQLDVDASFKGFSQITLQAKKDITVTRGTRWDLAQSTGVEGSGSLLSLQAGEVVRLEPGAQVLGGSGWSVSLEAGTDFVSGKGIVSGVGSIFLDGLTGSGTGIQAYDGNISLAAGKQVLLQYAFVRTAGGGDVSVTALAGNVNCGTRENGFRFSGAGIGYGVDPELGGISTARGGNVHIRAGGDVTAYLPALKANHSDGGSGAFGAEPGDVKVEAGGSVFGHFVLRKGKGNIKAGQDAGTSNKLLALSLVDGQWSVEAGRDVGLQEARNPNGTFNTTAEVASGLRQFFDYAPDAGIDLSAGRAVYFVGGVLPRRPGSTDNMVPIYPPRLSVEAGAGGVILAKELRLFPSPSGGLQILTHDQGPLKSLNPGQTVSIVLSDSSRHNYRSQSDFGADDHAVVPVHLDKEAAFKVAVSGHVSDIDFVSATAGDIRVGGDLLNSSYRGQNLSRSDATRIAVVGKAENRSDFSFIYLPAGVEPDLALLGSAVRVDPSAPDISAYVRNILYNPVTRRLAVYGRMSAQVRDALLQMRVQVIDQYGNPVFDRDLNPVTRPAVFLDPTCISQLYEVSQQASTVRLAGYKVDGPGSFQFSADTIALGASDGIQSTGPMMNPNLVSLLGVGASLEVKAQGDISLFTSVISSYFGGKLRVASEGGFIDVGSQDLIIDDRFPRGIIGLGGGDVSVEAYGPINVNGSRIAAYDGGNIDVLSMHGDLDAGKGGSGYVKLYRPYVDPVTGSLAKLITTIPGSGVLSTSFPEEVPGVPSLPPGSIRVRTPEGDIRAQQGGIVQLSLNKQAVAGARVTLIAGSKDSEGKVVHVGNIDASGSGVIGYNIDLDATGDIKGVVVARENIDITSKQNVNVTAVASGGVNVAAGGTVSGTVVGVGSVTASGASIDAALMSQNVSSSGSVSGQVGFASTAVAGSTAQAAVGSASESTAKVVKSEEDDSKKKDKDKPKLARTIGRVTVILPKM